MFEGNSWGRAWKFRYRVDFEKRGGEGYRPGQRMERFQREIPSVSYYQFQCRKKYRYRCDLTPAAYPGKRITGGEIERERGRGRKKSTACRSFGEQPRAIVPAAPTFNAILL